MRKSVVGRWKSFMVVAALAVAATACRRTRLDIQYVPSGPPAPVLHASVTLEVSDSRPPDRGGLDPERVGWVRGSWGRPTRLRVAREAVPQNVWAATADSLQRVGVGAGGGSQRLLATVLDFWDDGLTSEGSHVVVRYQLVDVSGRERWSAVVASGTGEPGEPAPSPPETAYDPGRPINMFTYALDELATRARAAFATPAFQQAIAP